MKQNSKAVDGPCALYLSAYSGLATTAGWAAPVALRVALALPFLRSGLTRWDGPFTLSASTLYLFEEQFRLHVFGQAYAFPFPDQTALLVATAEMVLPTLLLIGLGARWAALGLLLMTAVIQLVVPEGGLTFHINWAAMAIALLAIGPGPLSLDRLVGAIARRGR